MFSDKEFRQYQEWKKEIIRLSLELETLLYKVKKYEKENNHIL